MHHLCFFELSTFINVQSCDHLNKTKNGHECPRKFMLWHKLWATDIWTMKILFTIPKWWRHNNNLVCVYAAACVMYIVCMTVCDCMRTCKCFLLIVCVYVCVCGTVGTCVTGWMCASYSSFSVSSHWYISTTRRSFTAGTVTLYMSSFNT